jgi:cysteine desulfurase
MENFNRRIYLDHSATTPVLPEVAKAVYDAMTIYFGNASEPHFFGVEAKKILEQSRLSIANAIKSHADEILFTSGGTESNNMAIFGIVEGYYKKGNHIITSEIEHPAVLMPLKILENEGFEITYLPVDSNGIVDPQDIKNAITNKTILITIMHSNNIVGALQPIEETGKITKEYNVIFHCDAVQSYMSSEIDVDKLNVDLLSISGHKIYAPKGAGALYIRKGTKIMPQMFGGGQERGRRSGTENIPGILGLAKATEILMSDFKERNQRIAKLRDYLRDGVLQNIQDVIYNGHPDKRLPGNCNFTFKNVEASDIVSRLNEYGIAISAGSACKSASSEASSTLLAMGICPEYARSSVRITLGRENTKEEIDYLLNVLPEVISSLRNKNSSYEDRDKYFIF